MRKITDLEHFAEWQIFRPFRNMIGLRNTPLHTIPYGLDEIVGLFKKNPSWERNVLERMKGCDFRIPYYINHPLVDFLYSNSAIKITHADL